MFIVVRICGLCLEYTFHNQNGSCELEAQGFDLKAEFLQMLTTTGQEQCYKTTSPETS